MYIADCLSESVNYLLCLSLSRKTDFDLSETEIKSDMKDYCIYIAWDCNSVWSGIKINNNMPLLFLLSFLQSKVKPYLCVSSRLTASSHFLSVFVSLLVCLPVPYMTAIYAGGQRERTLAMTTGLKYPHDMRVSSNETPDRCLHKLSPIAVAHSLPHPRWGWLWAIMDVPGVCVCVC